MAIEAFGLDQFAHETNASALREIMSWHDHPQLGRILNALRRHQNRKAFLDAYAEAMVARHLLAKKCKLNFEVPAPSGKRSDFEVIKRDFECFLHVKRLDSHHETHHPNEILAMSAKLRALERIPRPFLVQVRWREQLSQSQMKLFVREAREFLKRAKIGDELRITDRDGHDIGGLLVIAPWDGDRVSVMIGLPSGFVDQAPRFRKLLDRAHQQFMPRALNVIFICSGHEDDAVDFETALLGSHIERWDAYPPRGKRIAYGRAADGFWAGKRVHDSQAAVWAHLGSHSARLTTRLWIRPATTLDESTQRQLKTLFGTSR